MEKLHFIDVYKNKDICDNFKLSVYMDPVRNYVQSRCVQFPWIYRAQPSVLYLEELDPEKRIQDAYRKGERIAKETVLFHPYKKPYTSRILKKFILEDPYDPKRAMIKYCNEKPIKFIIFGKPGLNLDSLAIELANYWKTIHITPKTAINDALKYDENLLNILQTGSTVGLNYIITSIKRKLESVEAKKHGYVLTGLPMRQKKYSKFDVIEQMELIFDTENRPDIIIYVTSPSSDVGNLNKEGFIEDIDTGYYYNKNHINEGENLETYDEYKPYNFEKVVEKNYKHYLVKEYEKYFNIQKHGYLINIGPLPTYSEILVKDYIIEILPIIDSYILEYDAQCVIKVDGRTPITRMFDIIKTKLSMLPFLPQCEAKPMFDEVMDKEPDVFDDRSLDSIEEDKPELVIEEEDDEEDHVEDEGEEEEVEKEVVNVEGEETESPKDNKALQYFENMAPKQALQRLKEFNTIHPNFQWTESDFGAHCPVEYERGHICYGVPKYACSYLGKLFMMSSKDAMQEFLYDPNRFAIPPKPFPTCKIFVTGPPYSGKTTVVQLFSKFFNLEVISIKQLIEEIRKEKFHDLQIRELVKKEKRLTKLQNIEDEIFQSYELRRGSDIINWVKDQLPYIYQRIHFTSLIEIPLDELDENVEEELEESEEELEILELILPTYHNFIDSLIKLSRSEVNQILSTKKYTVDLPEKSGFEKIYDNIKLDLSTMIAKKMPFEEAIKDLKELQNEFKNRGLKFDLSTEEYIEIFTNPLHLLKYLPNQFRQPYYTLQSVDFDDVRLKTTTSQDFGIRSAFGYITVNMEELVDKFEKRILDIEAEINIQRHNKNLQIGGWIVDDIPIHKSFWDILVERYLLPDDIIIRTVEKNSYKDISKNFCNITNTINTSNKLTETINLEHDNSNDSIKEIEANRFLEVKNSFMKINQHYKNELMPENQEQNIKKTCSEVHNIIVREDVLPKRKLKTTEPKRYLYSTKDSSFNSKIEQDHTEINPFDIKLLPVKSYPKNYWTDQTFLTTCFQDMVSIYSKTKPNLNILYTAEVKEKPSEIIAIEDERALNTIPNIHKSDIDPYDESISSSDTSIVKLKEHKIKQKGYFDKARLSIQKKVKTKQPPMTLYEAKHLTNVTKPESLFQLHNKVILKKTKQKTKIYDLLQVFYREITSHISSHPLKFELRYLTEIKQLLQDNNLNQVAHIMAKYLMKIKREPDLSEDNIGLKMPSIDLANMKRFKPREISEILDQTYLKRRLKRVASNVNLDVLKSESSLSTSYKDLRKIPAESNLSHMSLPPISKSKSSLPEKYNEIDILCHKESNTDTYKSSSIILNIESIPSRDSNDSMLQRKKNKTFHLPMIQSTHTSSRSCCCLKEGKTNCTCSPSDSDIKLRRKKNHTCIWDTAPDVLPWIPTPTHIQPTESDEYTLRRYRDKLAINATTKYNAEPIDVIHEMEMETYEPYICPEEQQIEDENDEMSLSTIEIPEEEIRKEKLSKKETLERIPSLKSSEGIPSVYSRNTIDILSERYNSDISFLQSTTSINLMHQIIPFEMTTSSVSSIHSFKFKLQEDISHTIKLHDSSTLLPGVASTDWERFITFVNSLYLSVSTLKEIGYEQAGTSFYLECCPSGSDTSINDYETRNSFNTEPAAVKRKIRTQAKEFTSELNKSDTSYERDEDVCVLEVALPMSEQNFNTALNTAIKCLTLGKTVSELFSANKHDTMGNKRLSSTILNEMYNDDEVQVLKYPSETGSSVQMPIDDVPSRDAIFNEDGELQTNNEVIELFAGNVKRYWSLDQRFRPSLEALPDLESWEQDDDPDEPNICPEIFLNTVPRAILYVPYVTPRFEPITDESRVRPIHIRRFYSLQSLCRMVYVEETEEEEPEKLKFKYVLTEPYTTKYQSIYIHTQTKKLYEPQYEAIEEEIKIEEEEQQIEEQEIDAIELQQIQDVIVPLIDRFREEIIKGELESYYAEGEEEESTESGTTETYENPDEIENDEENLQENELDEIEEEVKRKLTFSHPYDIIKLMFQKYDFITLILPENDLDSELENELNNMSIPKGFKTFLNSINYNTKMWLNEWDSFYNNVLSDINCNVINFKFLPFYENLQKHFNDGVYKLLHNYEPVAECIDLDKEKLIKTIDLETSGINVDEIEGISQVESMKPDLKERDLGDLELCEILPNKYSEFYPYCPVLYKNTNELIPINTLYKAEYKDKIYNFSSEDGLNEFIKWPERFAWMKKSDYNQTPIRICVVVPPDFDAVFISRHIGDYFSLPIKMLSSEIKRIQGTTLNLPVGVFDEDQTSIKLFSLEDDLNPKTNPLENSEWDHIRNYYNLISPLTDTEMDGLIDPLWSAEHGMIFHAFPHAYNDLEHMIQTRKIPDVIVFIDTEQDRITKQIEIEERIKTRQLLNFAARLRRLIEADHVRYKIWLESYPTLFKITLRKFLRERRAERNFRERLKLVLPTIKKPEEQDTGSITEEVEEAKDVKLWDVEWLASQVDSKPLDTSISTVADERDTTRLKKNKKYMNVLDNPNITEDQKRSFLDEIQNTQITVEEVKPVLVDYGSEEEAEEEEESLLEKRSREINLSDIEFPNLQTIFEQSLTEITEEEYESEMRESEEKLNKGIKLLDRREVAMHDFFEPTPTKKYLPKLKPVIYKSLRPFNEDDYKHNVTDASSTSLLGLDQVDSIESKELTSSLSLLDIESHNKQLRLTQLVLGNKTALKGHFDQIVKTFKDTYPTPLTNVRKLKFNPTNKTTLKTYYKNEKDHIKRMKELCQTQNIPFVVHNSTSHTRHAIQNIKNVLRKPNPFDNVYILDSKTATKLLENGFYFLSRFGYWCPVQIYERNYPIQNNYSKLVKEKIIIPLLYKSYIYFIHGRKSAIKFIQSPVQYVEQDNMLTIFPVKIAIVGFHKSRKTSMAKKIARHYGLDYITREITINYVLENVPWSELAKTALNYLRNGDTLPSSIIIKCMEAFINSSTKSLTYGWIMDGYPINNKDIKLMRENNIIPNVILGVEPNEDYIKEMFCLLNKDRNKIQNQIYTNKEYIDMEEEEDDIVPSTNTNTEPEQENTPLHETAEDQINEEGEEEEHKTSWSKLFPQERLSVLEYINKIKGLISAKHSSIIEITKFIDLDKEIIEFEIQNLLPPIPMIETKMLFWLTNIKHYDTLLNTANTIWGNVHKMEWNNEEGKLLDVLNDVALTYIWALQDYNLNIAKGLPTSLYLIGITEEEYFLHKSPFNDCCPGCWYYHKIYFRCPTCVFKDMLPGLIQYENFFYWLCIQHYNTFLSNPLHFLMSYNITYTKHYPEKTSIGESFLKDNLNIQYDGYCITCYFNNLPNLTYIKGYGKHSVVINKTEIYLFCSNKCVCEMLMRPARYLNLQIEYKDLNLPVVEQITKTLPCKGLFEQIVSDAVYDAIRHFLFIRPKIFGLSHKISACTYLALQLKLKAKSLSKRKLRYFTELMKYLDNHCKELEMVCKNIDQIYAFMGPLSIIEHTKAKCLPSEAQDELLKNILPKHTHPEES